MKDSELQGPVKDLKTLMVVDSRAIVARNPPFPHSQPYLRNPQTRVAQPAAFHAFKSLYFHNLLPFPLL
jgi:hypothetical protein